MTTCEFYISPTKPECGEPGIPVSIRWPKTGHTQHIKLCSNHLDHVRSVVRNQRAASTRLSGRAQKRAKEAGQS